MITLLRSIHKVIKQRKNRSLQPINNEVTYSIGTRCTGKEKLPKMENKDYILLYGMSDSIYSQELNGFKAGYNKKPFELFIDKEHVKKRIVEKQRKLDNDSEIGNVILNYVGVAIKRCNVLDTSELAEDIEKLYKRKKINIENEKRVLQRFSLDRGYQVYSVKPVYKEIYAKSFFTKLVKPTAYIIADTNVIISVAIGDDAINKMAEKLDCISKEKARKKQEELEQKQKQAQVEEQKKLRLQDERQAKWRQTMVGMGELVEKAESFMKSKRPK